MVSSGITSNFFTNFPVDSQTFGSNKNQNADFGELMTQSMLSNGADLQDAMKTIGNVPGATNNVSNTAVMGDNKVAQADNKSQVSDKEDISDSSVKENDSASLNKQVTSKNDADESDSSEKVDDTTKEQTVDALKKIKDKIVEEFEVTDEEIENALMSLGFSMVDLLDESNITDFVVELTGMESSLEIITDADMNAILTDLTQYVTDVTENLKESLELTDEDLEQIIGDITFEDIVSDTITTTENVVDKNVSVVVDAPKEENEIIDKQVKEEFADSTETNVNDNQVNVPNEVEVSTSNDKDNQNSFSRRDNRDSGVKSNFNEAVGNIVNNLSEAVNEVFEASGVSEGIDAANIIEQIIETAKVTLNQEITSMEMMLNPENLGKVNLNVSVKEGVVTATITAQDEMVKSAIENQITILKENLNNQGLKIQAVEVTVESHAFEAGTEFNQNSGYDNNEQSKKKSNRQLRLDSLDDLVLEQLTDDEKIVLDMMQKEGNQVNFTA